MKRRLLPWIGIAIFITVWFLIGLLHIVPRTFFDSPYTVFITMLKLLFEGRTWLNIGATLWRMFVGFFLAIIVGVPIGLFVGYSQHVRSTLESLIDFLRSIPATALLPLFIVTLGFGDAGKIALVVFSATLIISMYTMLGVLNSSKAKQQYARTLGASKKTILLKVVFPDAMPSIFAGLRVSISLALVLVIVAEMVMTPSDLGLGGNLFLARYQTEYTVMYALIAICGIIGFCLNRGFQILGDRLIHWKKV